jgi:dolichol-phosphate mannosyltransferase
VPALIVLPTYQASTLAGVGLETVRADGYGFQIELVHRVASRGASVVEIPVRFSDRTRGRSKMSGWIVAEALVLVSWWGLKDRLPLPKRSH